MKTENCRTELLELIESKISSLRKKPTTTTRHSAWKVDFLLGFISAFGTAKELAFAKDIASTTDIVTLSQEIPNELK